VLGNSLGAVDTCVRGNTGLGLGTAPRLSWASRPEVHNNQVRSSTLQLL